MSISHYFWSFQNPEIDNYNFTTVLVDPPRSGLNDKVINFLKTFNNIVNYTCNNNDFPWNLVQNGVSVPGDGKYQFVHEFKSETGVMSPYNYLLRNLYLRLGVNTLWRCKMNLKIKTKKTHVFYPFHTDFTTLPVPFTTESNGSSATLTGTLVLSLII